MATSAEINHSDVNNVTKTIANEKWVLENLSRDQGDGLMAGNYLNIYRDITAIAEETRQKLKDEKDRSQVAELTAIQKMQERYKQLQEDIAALNKKIANEEAAIEGRNDKIDNNQSEIDILTAQGKGDSKEADDLRTTILLLQEENVRGQGRIVGLKRDVEVKEREAEDLEREYTASGGDPKVLEDITQKALQENGGNEAMNIAKEDVTSTEARLKLLAAKGHDESAATRHTELETSDEIRLASHGGALEIVASDNDFLESLKATNATSTGSALDGSRTTSVISANFDVQALGVTELAFKDNDLQVADLTIDTASNEITLGLSTTTLGG